ncbi:hypothetical protein ACTXG7_00130 [Mycolicibacterium sp. Dal123E01]|uniref:hypothetical protein n=1 Tax=Mycolicibacterium sp. Dal123E01 TaxID=3457578 RepID=UPI00403EDC6B
MSRRWWWIGTAVIVTAAVGVGLWLMLGRKHSGDDCATAREMIAVTRDHRTQVDTQANAGIQPGQDEYEKWAGHLNDLAARIEDPKLAPHAHRMADLARQSVALNPAILAELSASPPALGPAAAKYAELNKQFVAEQRELAQDCPG